MKILSVPQIRAADAYTIAHEPIASDDLMERAAAAFTVAFVRFYPPPQQVHIYCGTGNNGGDGLCIARQLCLRHYEVVVYIVWFNEQTTDDFSLNLQRLQTFPVPIQHLHHPNQLSFSAPNNPTLIIDALLGSGISRPIKASSLLGNIVLQLNQTAVPIIAVDMPSGLLADTSTTSPCIVKAQHSITFELPKLAFLLAENHAFVGNWQAVPIGLHPSYLAEASTNYYYITPELVANSYQKPAKFAHKGTKGHVLVIGGSYGKIGACVMAAQAALQIGAGLCTAYVPACGYNILQTAAPEVMTLCDPQHHYISQLPDDLTPYQSLAIGVGIGTATSTQAMIDQFLSLQQQSMVIDADALNIIAHNNWQHRIPPQSILTPHPKELERLIGKTAHHFERLERLQQSAIQWQSIVVLKGAHTAIACPDGKVYFNSTGNPYMGTGGSGDILTGIIAGLLAQGYTPQMSAILGVYWHGQAGDRAASLKKPLRATDLIPYLQID